MLTARGARQPFPTTAAELDYLNGIERLDNAMPVRLTVNADGIEVKEVMPGTRVFQIAADAILEARVTRRVEKIKVEKPLSLLQKILLDDSILPQRQFTEEFLHDYILTVRYRFDGKTCSAAFHREEKEGKSLINSVAKAINQLLKYRMTEGTK